jgi:rare lipoprotein A
MQKSVLTLLTLSMMAATVPAHAELVQPQSLANSTATVDTNGNLATRILDNDEQDQSSTLFKMSASDKAAKATSTDAPTAKSKTDIAATQAKASSKNDDDDNGIIHRLSTAATDAVHKFKQSGIASWYGPGFNGRKTASGETFNTNAMTAAHRTLPLNCFVRVTNKDNGKSVVVKVNDRGPFHANRVLDLSHAAASKLGINGTGNVTIERVNAPE